MKYQPGNQEKVNSNVSEKKNWGGGGGGGDHWNLKQ